MLNFWLDGWDQIRHYLLLIMCTMKNMPRPQTRKENKQLRQERGVVFDRCWRHSLRGRIFSESLRVSFYYIQLHSICLLLVLKTASSTAM